MRVCKCCEEPMTGHPNKKFCSQRCKDRWHNATNLRGIQAHHEPYIPKTTREREEEEAMDTLEAGWDGHKNIR